mgnify:CR=1 FL=1
MTELENIIYHVLIYLGITIILLFPFSMNYTGNKAKGKLDPNKSFLENFFSA